MSTRKPLGALGWLALACAIAAATVAWTVDIRWLRILSATLAAGTAIVWFNALRKRDASLPGA
jgi:hypothetical protein